MITEAKIYIRVKLNWLQIAVTMLCIWDFSEKDSAEILKCDENLITELRRQLRKKFDEQDTRVMALHALLSGFKIDGTLNNEDIFSVDQKRKILLMNDAIEFRHTPK